VPADGFFEWQVTPDGKEPHRIILENENLFSFAGLFDEWLDRAMGELLHTFTTTTEANDVVKPIHNRMPLILSPYTEELWLDQHESQLDLLSLLVPYEGSMKAYKVSDLVNSPANDIPDLLNYL
jgi:putative SOS response-associated peptidase YedK